MNAAPRGVRLHIGIFGRRNVGKSSLLNALTRQQVSIVSPEPGTTTDPVEKPMELHPLGPVLFIDTAGIDDVGALGAQRVERTMKALDRTELAVLVLAEDGLGSLELALLDAFEQRKIPVLPVLNKCDLAKPADAVLDRLIHRGFKPIVASAEKGDGISQIRTALVELAPDEYLNAPTILSDLVPAPPASSRCWSSPWTRKRPRAGSSCRSPRPSGICSTTTPTSWWSRSASCAMPSAGSTASQPWS
jgi:small GTP-binding protein